MEQLTNGAGAVKEIMGRKYSTKQKIPIERPSAFLLRLLYITQQQ
jgi:hypothetical protein